MRILFFSLLFLVQFSARAQSPSNQLVEWSTSSLQREPSTKTIAIGNSPDALVRSVSLKWTNKSQSLKRPEPEFSITQFDGKVWTTEVAMTSDHEMEDDGNGGAVLPFYVENNTEAIKITTSSLEEINIMANIFTAHADSEYTSSELLSNACFCDTLSFKNRKAWNCPQTNVSPGYAKVTHLIVHHAAGPNTSNDWGATVLSIWDYHTKTNGWSDVGYNWLIAPDGTLYEGRGGGENAIGAHFCGRNTGTMGVCMLGNLSTAQPTQAALNTLAKILHWKSCDAALNPLSVGLHNTSGLNLNIVSGHRDGCATECPGNNMYPMLGTVRQMVQNRLVACQPTDIDEINIVSTNGMIYPNPSTSANFSISSGFDIDHISIYNTLGQEVFQQAAKELIHITTQLSRGTYIIKLKSTNQQKSYVSRWIIN